MTSPQPNVEAIFSAAREKVGSERTAYLDRACGDDAGLRKRVEALLAADAAAGEFLAVDTEHVYAASDIDQVFATKDTAAPQQIGPYKILDVLGEGGMGTVYIAEQKEPIRRRVALKIIKQGMDSKQVLRRFEAERQALAMMEHGHIAKVFEAGTTESGQPFFAMEYVKGKPITQYCDEQKLGLEERLELFRQVCFGVHHAHSKGVIHRDLKPSNVLVSDQDGNPMAKIIDFGVARATDHRLVEATIFTEQGVIVGTPEYMSPEQAGLDALDIDTRSDVYSLGVLLYELLVGELPFSPAELRQAGLREMERMIRDEDPPKPSTRLTGSGTGTAVAEQRRMDLRSLTRRIKGDLDWIAMKALEKNRNRRYQSATELAEDIQRHLDHEPVLAGPPSASYRIKKLIRRYRVGRPWPAVSGALLVALFIIVFVPPGQIASPRVLGDPQLLTDLGNVAWPSISPDGQSFVYTNADDGDIYWQPAEFGEEPRLLTGNNPDFPDLQAAYHPTEDKIAYRRDEIGISVIRTDGTEYREIVDESEDTRKYRDGGFHPSWSPDGTELVYNTMRDTDPYSIPQGGVLFVDVASGRQRRLLGNFNCFSPSWSPHDQWIAISPSNGGGSTTFRMGQKDIWIIRPWGGPPKMVTNDLDVDFYPFWSPDGRFLYFISDRKGRPGLWAVRIDEESGEHGKPREVWAHPSGRILSASISGDGLRIVCSVIMETYVIRSFDFDPASGQLAGDPTPLHRDTQQHPQGLTLSPDDEWLAFATTSGQEDVFFLRADGTSRRPIPATEDAFKARKLAWYPEETDEGYWLTFSSDRDGPRNQIYAIHPDRREAPRLLTNPDADFWSYVWRPDGSFRGAYGHVYDFPDGFPGRASQHEVIEFPPDSRPSWSRDGQMIATIHEDGIRVISADNGEELHIVRDGNDEPYTVQEIQGRGQGQSGNRWLDDKRLVFWDSDLKNAFLWDTDTEQATAIDGLDDPGEYVFSEDGETLYALQRVSSSDIWLLELDPESLDGGIGPRPDIPAMLYPEHKFPVFLGASVKRLDRVEELAATGMDAERGVLVLEVPEGSPADVARLQANDVILSVDGVEIHEPREIQPEYLKTGRSAKSEFTIFRDRREITHEVDGVLAIRLTARDPKSSEDVTGPGFYEAAADWLFWWPRDESASLIWELTYRGSVTFDVFAEYSGDDESTWLLTIAGETLEVPARSTGSRFEVKRFHVGSISIEGSGNIQAELKPWVLPEANMPNFRAIELIAR